MPLEALKCCQPLKTTTPSYVRCIQPSSDRRCAANLPRSLDAQAMRLLCKTITCPARLPCLGRPDLDPVYYQPRRFKLRFVSPCFCICHSQQSSCDLPTSRPLGPWVRARSAPRAWAPLARAPGWQGPRAWFPRPTWSRRSCRGCWWPQATGLTRGKENLIEEATSGLSMFELVIKG